MSLNLQQNLETKLSLTPQVIQSLEILSFSLEELENFIKKEAESNPLIELKERDTEYLIDMARIQSTNSYESVADEKTLLIDQLSNQEDSMEFYLLEQLTVKKRLTKKEREIVLYLIRNLNDSGYLDCECEIVATKFGVSIEKCEELIRMLQSCEPAGIAARNLAECLYLQVMRKEDVPPYTDVLIQYHLEDLAEGKFQTVMDSYGLTKEEVENIFIYIKNLNPRPKMEIQSPKQEYIIPDIIVKELNGEIVFHMNDQFLPQISINSYYEELLRINNTEEINDYLKMKLSDAFLLMRGIELRHETLYKVTKSILEKQRGFLQYGKKALLPLGIKDIAESVGLHESTVSRTVRHKYIQSAQGIVPLRTFFIRGVKMQSGEVESPTNIKEKIKSIILMENENKPLSDQKIANYLLAEGIPIARRTVAKYRKELGIPHSTKRKQTLRKSK